MTTKTMPPWVINAFFLIGLVSGFLFRATIIANHFDPLLGRIFWYVAVTGYIFFFGYRFYIAKKRRHVILTQNLIEKVEQTDLPLEDKDNVVYLLQSLVKSKEMFNYIMIFILSIVAVLFDVILTIL